MFNKLFVKWSKRVLIKIYEKVVKKIKKNTLITVVILKEKEI